MIKKRIHNIQSKFDNRILNAIIYGVGGAIVSKGLLMIFNIFASRILGSTNYGIYSIINNTVQTFIIFSGAGLGVTLTRYVALLRDKDKDNCGAIIKTLFVFNLVLSIIISIIIFIFADKISFLLDNKINISFYVRIMSCTILITSLVSILQCILQGFEKYKSIAKVQVSANIIVLSIGIIIMNLMGTVGAILTILLLQFVTLLLYIISVYKSTKEFNIKMIFKFNKMVKQSILKMAIPAFLSSVFVLPLLWILNFLFTKSNGYDKFAAFSVCLQWFTILNYLPQQFGQMKPIYTQLYDSNKMADFKRIVKKMMIVSVLLSTIASLILIVMSGFIMSLYGSYYISYKNAFIIILIASIFYSIQSQFGSVFQAIGKQWMCFWLNIIWAVTLIFSFIVFRKYDVVGYSIAYCISYGVYSFISCLYFYIIIKKKI